MSKGQSSAGAGAVTQTAAPPVTSYDEMPYPADAMPQTHPEALAVAALLRGMTPAQVENCRVLELGCANGGNLLPMAELLPRSRFVGVDLSSRQIAEGQSMIAALALSNIELFAADLTTLDDSLGTFDYIICHGLYSWVPRPVQKSILALCARHLSAQGIAYISYNTLPGFHKQQIFRGMMRYDTASIKDPDAAARRGLALLEFLSKNTGDEKGVYAQLLREEVERLRELPLSYLFHEHLETDNHPFYFSEFVADAATHGLRFLAEADKSGVELLPKAAQTKLAALRNDEIRREQYIDFLRNSTLRSTLLCRADIALSQDLEPQKLKPLEVRSCGRPKIELREAALRSHEAVLFATRFGSVKTEHPAVKSLGFLLHGVRPAAIPVAELAPRIAALSGQPITMDELCELLLYAYRIGFITLHTQRRPRAQKVTERPLATPLTRILAQRQTRVSSLWHEPVSVNALQRQVLQKLDGNHDTQALQALLISAGVAPNQAAAALSQILEHCLLFGLLTA